MHKFADPDLILRVTQEYFPNNQRALRYIAKTRDPQLGLYLARFDSKAFQGDPQDHFRQLFQDIAHLPRDRSADWIADRGAQLCQELLPLELRRWLLALLNKVRTVQILSDEVWIPWELLRIHDPDDPSLPGRFLSEAFSVTRWLLGSPLVLDLPMRRVALVIPRDSSLPKCLQEAVQVRSLGGGSREVVDVPAAHEEVKRALASGRYEGWHFAGHGLAPGESLHSSSLVLERKEMFHPTVLYGSGRQLGLGRPLVFLNACHSGRGGPSLTGLAGWASAFLQAGAGAFIGSHWALEDDQALRFAENFYRGLFSGVEIGEAVRSARSRLRHEFPGTSDWLSYTVFAHPFARCQTLSQDRETQAPQRRAKRRRTISATEAGRIPKGLVEEKSRAGLIEAISQETPASEGTGQRTPASGEEYIHEKTGMILVYVPGGEIHLGDLEIHSWSGPVRRVRMSPFWIGKYPVTNEEYARFLEENPSLERPAFYKDTRFNQPRHPVVGLSWEEALAYCHWAGLELPGEAQWEMAARGTDQRPYPWGRELPTPRHANFGGTCGGTTPVDAFPAGVGPYGTFDQAGNVWEWCADPWAPDFYRHMEDGQRDPFARGETAVRALRGGCWMNPAHDLHAAYRDRGTAKLRFNSQGFRCLLRAR